jgi:hypothetical protein
MKRATDIPCPLFPVLYALILSAKSRGSDPARRYLSTLLACLAVACTAENPDPECPSIGTSIRVTVSDGLGGDKICGASVSIARDDGMTSTCDSTVRTLDCAYVIPCGMEKSGWFTLTVTSKAHQPAKQRFLVHSYECGVDRVGVDVNVYPIHGLDAGVDGSASTPGSQ